MAGPGASGQSFASNLLPQDEDVTEGTDSVAS